MRGGKITVALDLLRSILWDRPFFYVIYFITARCPSKCKTCFDWRRQTEADIEKELSLDQIEKLSRSFKTIILSLTGGEPFIRKDLTECCLAFCRSSGVRILTIPTGAQYPTRIRDFLSTITTACPNVTIILKLSLDGLHEKHDELRGTPGNFESFLEAVEHIRRCKAKCGSVKLKVCTTVSAYNISELEDLAAFVETEIRPDYHSLKLLHGDPRCGSECLLDRERYNAAVEKIRARFPVKKRPLSFIYARFQKLAQNELDRSKRGEPWRYRCRAGRNFIVIRENGDVMACEAKKLMLGNLKNNNCNLGTVISNSDVVISDNCSCDWECAPTFSLLYNWRGYWDFLRNP